MAVPPARTMPFIDGKGSSRRRRHATGAGGSGLRRSIAASRRRRGLGVIARLLALGQDARAAAVDRLLLDRRQPALVVGDDEHVLELVEVGGGLEVGGLDDVVGVAADVDDLADEEALGNGERMPPPSSMPAVTTSSPSAIFSPESIWLMIRTPPSWPTTSPVAAFVVSWPMTVESAVGQQRRPWRCPARPR